MFNLQEVKIYFFKIQIPSLPPSNPIIREKLKLGDAELWFPLFPFLLLKTKPTQKEKFFKTPPLQLNTMRRKAISKK